MQAGSGRAGDSGSTSRWNPTKEQIDMLENFYKQGVRTPSAEQIQQITSRLKAFGHIEGKNVFYWFQNHKARQRQKQKQESIAYNRLLHRRTTQPIFLPRYDLNPPCPNGNFIFYFKFQDSLDLRIYCSGFFRWNCYKHIVLNFVDETLTHNEYYGRIDLVSHELILQNLSREYHERE